MFRGLAFQALGLQLVLSRPRTDHLHHPAGATQPDVRPVGRAQPVQDLADGGADRRHESWRVYPL